MNGSSARTTGRIAAIAAALLALVLSSDVAAQRGAATTHTIFLTALEIKGSTTTDKLPPPSINPADLSKGYGFKAPGQADPKAPQKWEVSSYLFAPAAVTVRQGDTVVLTVFVVNGDEHEVWIAAPDGQKVMPNTIWNRGREYRAQFVAAKVGTYQLACSNHAPSMIATFVVLPE
jgi:plastocyanin